MDYYRQSKHVVHKFNKKALSWSSSNQSQSRSSPSRIQPQNKAKHKVQFQLENPLRWSRRSSYRNKAYDGAGQFPNETNSTSGWNQPTTEPEKFRTVTNPTTELEQLHPEPPHGGAGAREVPTGPNPTTNASRMQAWNNANYFYRS